MRELILPEFSLNVFKMTAITWTSECADKSDEPGKKMQKLMVSHFDANR